MRAFLPNMLSILFALLQIAIPASVIAASSELVVDRSSFRESYDSVANVSGNTIVGLRLGKATGNIAVDDVHILTPSAQNICIRIVSLDGRFSANNLYQVSSPTSDRASTRSRLSPVTIRHASALSQYSNDHLAINAFLPVDGKCTPDKSIHFPQISTSDLADADLVVLVNSGGREADVRIDQEKEPVSCSNIKGTRVAFDKRCVIPASRIKPGRNSFILLLDDGFSEETTNFAVMLPEK